MKAFIGKYPKKYGKHRRSWVKIDSQDLWSADYTLAFVILPLLKKFRTQYGGAPFVDIDDVPDALKPPPDFDFDSGATDDKFFARWEWVLDEMIFAFESFFNDWQAQFDRVYIENGELGVRSFNTEGFKAYDARIQRGLELFGKYYRCLWN